MTDLLTVVNENGDELVIFFDERRIGIDVYHVERKSMRTCRCRQCDQRRDHVIAEMTISPAIDSEMRRGYSPTRIDRNAVLSPRRIWNVTLDPVSTFDSSWLS